MNTLHIIEKIDTNLLRSFIFQNKLEIDNFDNINTIILNNESPLFIKSFVENNFEIVSIKNQNNLIFYTLNRNIHTVEITDGKNYISYQLTDTLIRKIDYFLFYKDNKLPDTIKIEISPEDFHNTIHLINSYIYKNIKILNLLGIPLDKEYIIQNTPKILNAYIVDGKITLDDIIRVLPSGKCDVDEEYHLRKKYEKN